jgi:hypothetical protein
MPEYNMGSKLIVSDLWKIEQTNIELTNKCFSDIWIDFTKTIDIFMIIMCWNYNKA